MLQSRDDEPCARHRAKRTGDDKISTALQRWRVRLLKDTVLPLAGHHVLLVEDVVDTGLTLNYLSKLFQLRRPESLRVAALLDRPYRRLVDDLPVDYVGFTVPDEFFVGYGFDVDGRWRNLPDLRIAKV